MQRRSPLDRTKRSRRRLFLEQLETRSMLAAVIGVAPAANSHTADLDTQLRISVDGVLDAATINADSVAIHSNQSERGEAATNLSGPGNELFVSPAPPFFPGELIQATVRSSVLDTAAQPTIPHTWQFRAAATEGSGIFGPGQAFGSDTGASVALGDLDGDGDLDALIGNRGGNRVWLNADGQLSDSGQILGDHRSLGLALGDFDGDGDLDAIVANSGLQANRVWLNDSGVFTDSGQELVDPDDTRRLGRNSVDIAVGDLDGDGDLDAFVANNLQGNAVLLNEGGVFTESALLGEASSSAVVLGDLDGDGDLDAFVTNSYQANRVWLNDGGVFTDSGQALGQSASRDVQLGDFDGDGDLDAFVANRNQPDRIWRNEAGTFVDSGQRLGSGPSSAVALGDVDADGDLDAFVTSSLAPNRVWLNESGNFTDSGQELARDQSNAVALGDVDGDGDLDGLVVRETSNLVWENLNPTFSIGPQALVLPEGTGTESIFNFIVTRSFDLSGAVSVDYGVILEGAQSAQANDFSGGMVPSGRLTFAAGQTSQTVSIAVNGDAMVENDEQFTVAISNPSGRAVLGKSSALATIRNDEGADFGDLPQPFPTTLADNGPAHIAVGPTLGAGRDIDADGQPSPAAEADDLQGATDDEDGVTFSAVLAPGLLTGGVLVNASESARLDAWIDFDGDRSFDGVDEQIFRSREIQAGDNLLPFPVPGHAKSGQTFARFRVSTEGGLSPVGGASNGEVEDYSLLLRNPRGSGVFGDSQQSLGDHRSLAVALGDLDRDGDLDALVANGNDEGNRVWLNEGGQFTDGGQVLGSHTSTDVALGDLDGDGDLDAFVTNIGGNRVWLNTAGVLSDSQQELGAAPSEGVALGDLDRDGDLDAFVVNADEPNRVWWNQGDGVFASDSQLLGDNASRSVALGDLDGDGDLDAFVTNYNQPNRVWLNEQGQFSDSAQSLGDQFSWGVALGDVDDDGDLDALVTNIFQHTRLWLNDGGNFTDSGQLLGDDFGFGVALGDFDGDGDLDAMVANGLIDNPSSGNQVLLNDGGVFSEFEQPLGNHVSFDVAVGDLDGDGDLDAFTANYYQPGGLEADIPQGNRVWLNLQDESLFSIEGTGASAAEGSTQAGASFEFEVTRAGDLSQPASVTYAVAGSGAEPADAADFGGTLPSGSLQFAPGESRHTITVDVVGDSDVELDETFSVTLGDAAPTTARVVQATAEAEIQNDDLVPLTVFLSVDNDLILEDLGVATFSAVLSSPAAVDVTVDLAVSGTATLETDYAISGTQIVIPAGELSASVTVMATQDTVEEEPETIVVDIAAATNAVVGRAQQVSVIEDDDAPPETLFVRALRQTTSGFVAQLSLPPGELNLYDAERLGMGAADIVVVGADTGPVRGSAVLDSELKAIEFIKTDGPLLPDTYTVTFRSGADGVLSASGGQLDGDGDGVVGDDYTEVFTVAPWPENAVLISMPDIVRGPGQTVNIPGDSGTGIPLFVTTPVELARLDITIRHDFSGLQIISGGARPGPDVDPDVGLSLWVARERISIDFQGIISPGTKQIAFISAAIPELSGLHNQGEMIEIIATARTNNSEVIPVIVDDLLVLNSYFGDVTGNAVINANDASQVARVAAQLDSGFADFLTIDPILLGDISGNGRLNSRDASLVAQAAALFEVPQIPPIPAGIVAAGGGLPTIELGVTAVPLVVAPSNSGGIPSQSDDNSGAEGTAPEAVRPATGLSRAQADAALEEYFREREQARQLLFSDLFEELENR